MLEKFQSLIDEVQNQNPDKTILYVKKGEEPHLFTVLAKFKNEYATWLYNSSVCSLNWGHYFQLNELDKAIKDYKKRNY